MTTDPSETPKLVPFDDDFMRRRRIRRRLFAGVVLFLLAVPTAVAGYLYFFLRNTLPQLGGTAPVPGISRDVTIHRDERGIPRIYASNEADAYFALGWTHAGDRLFQMELLRRLSGGQLARLLGDIGLEEDLRSRRYGHRRMAEAHAEKLDERTRALLTAYVEGINTFVARTGKRTFEFKILRAPFDTWSVVDVLAIGSWQSWYGDALLSDDETYLELLENAGIEKAEAARFAYPAEAPTIVARGSLPESRSEIESLVNGLRIATASNAFAIAGSKSRSGEALIAFDPHVDITTLPGMWYVAGLHVTGEDGSTPLDAVGITVPGLPYVFMGHNGKSAWGFTAAGVDLGDFVRERTDPDDPTKYLTPEGPMPYEIVTEPVQVRGQKSPIELEVRITRHGPILFDGEEEDGDPIAIRWAGHDSDLASVAAAMLDMPTVTSFDRFRELTTALRANLEWFYADENGDIGYQLGAPVPIRAVDEALFPVSGHDGNPNWTGYAPLEETPHAFRPAKGWLASCNQKPRRSGADIPGTYVLDRILRAEELFADREAFDLDDLAAAQLDRVDADLRRWREPAAETLDRLGDAARAAALRAFDGEMSLTSADAALLVTWRSLLLELIFMDELGSPGTLRMLDRVFDDPDSPLFDDTRTDEVEDRAFIQDAAMRRALASTKDKTWGDLQSLTFSHPFSQARGAGFLGLVRGPFPRAGSPGALNASFHARGETDEFQSRIGPSWRFLLDFADLDACRMSLPAGQSGNPMSPFFFDFYESWDAGEYWTVPFSRAAVEESAKHTLRLTP